MIKREHIEKMKLLGAMLGDTTAGLSAVAINAGLEYAQRLTTDSTLQADVKATFKQDLAARDFRRATRVVEKYGKATEPPVRLSPNAGTLPPKLVPGKKNPLECAWEETDEGFRALELYVKTNKDNPPDNVDLRTWYASQSTAQY
jgi:hypothetical protein